MRLLTVEEVAVRLDVRPAMLYERVRSGELAAVKIGRYVRFHPESIEAWRPADVGGYAAALKRDRPCGDCGRDDLPSTEMHWHHVDPRTKLYAVASAPTMEAARAEAEKCILVCRACHAQRHREMGSVSRDVSPNGENDPQLSATENTGSGLVEPSRAA